MLSSLSLKNKRLYSVHKTKSMIWHRVAKNSGFLQWLSQGQVTRSRYNLDMIDEGIDLFFELAREVSRLSFLFHTPILDF